MASVSQKTDDTCSTCGRFTTGEQCDHGAAAVPAAKVARRPRGSSSAVRRVGASPNAAISSVRAGARTLPRHGPKAGPGGPRSSPPVASEQVVALSSLTDPAESTSGRHTPGFNPYRDTYDDGYGERQDSGDTE